MEPVIPGSDAAVQIESSRLAFAGAMRSGDATAAAAVYADDATLLAPASDILRGRAAIERFWRTGLETGIEHIELAVLDLEQRGDVAFELGRYAIHVAPEAGPSVIDRGPYLIVHRFGIDGRWRRAAEMFCPDRAPNIERR